MYICSWSYILYKFVVNDFSSTTETNLWQNVKWPVVIFQHAALLEVSNNIHLGFVHKRLLNKAYLYYR